MLAGVTPRQFLPGNEQVVDPVIGEPRPGPYVLTQKTSKAFALEKVEHVLAPVGPIAIESVMQFGEFSL